VAHIPKSEKMAQRFGRYFGTGAEYWGQLQLQHDLASRRTQSTANFLQASPDTLGRQLSSVVTE
jgi:plasmid maintenance system antidote protein VapI